MKKLWTSLLVGCLLSGSGLARAQDIACRTTPDAINSVLHIDGFSSPIPAGIQIWIGNFDFFGSSAVGACVHDFSKPGPTLHVILDSNNSLLGWLPKSFNHLCLTSDPETVDVVMQNETHCGVTMTPLNYNGNRLVMYGQGQVDDLHGGNGVDIFYGGSSKDYLHDSGTGPGANPIYNGTLMGESGDDRLWGSTASSTFLDGGVDHDGIADLGGSSDTLRGSTGNECCMHDSNDSFSIFHCGAGSDTVTSLSASKSQCDVANASCDAALSLCP